MDTMLRCLKEKLRDQQRASVMLLESPTGTGKSLSLACAAMAWLRHVEQVDLREIAPTSVVEEANTTGVDWLDSWVSPEQSHITETQKQVLQRAQVSRKALEGELKRLRSKLGSRERRENMVRSAVTTAKMAERKQHRKRRKIVELRGTSSSQDFCVDDYRSDGDTRNDSDENSYQEDNTKKKAVSETADLLNGTHLDGSRDAKGMNHSVGSVHPGSGIRKIVYAARTHSQLSQFVGELRRTHWGEDVRVVALGGRQILCGNTVLRGKVGKSESAISEACLDLQKDKNSACPLKASREAVSTLALHMLAEPCDIEDAARLGKVSQTCAYYASRVSNATSYAVYNIDLSLLIFHLCLTHYRNHWRLPKW
jgi:chromosome transmission fidelity protein 1